MNTSSDARSPAKRIKPALTAILFASALVGAAVEDRPLAAAAAHAPRTLVAVGQFVTGFGTSGCMFAFSGWIACIAVVAIGRGKTTWGGIPSCLAAERAV